MQEIRKECNDVLMKDIYNPNCNPKIYGTIYSTIVKYPKNGQKSR